MKIFNNIYKYITIAATLLATTACSDDLPMPSVNEGEGQPVTVKVNVELPKMSVMSRSDMIDGLDGQVTSLWIGVYSATSKERTGSKTITTLSAPTHGNPAGPVEIETKTGKSYIVAVANYAGRKVNNGTAIIDFAAALDDASTWDKFLNLSAMFDEDGDIHHDAPLNALLMSGHYIESGHTNGDYVAIEPVDIPKAGTLSGSIHLRRLISQVKFNVTYNTDNISDFEIIGWTVHNVPNQSWVYESDRENDINVGDLRQINGRNSYQTTATFNTFDPGTVNNVPTYSFDWWQLENKRSGLDGVTEYSHREEEYKAADNTNSGVYKSLVSSNTPDDANNNATFVELRARMTMEVDENGNNLATGTSRVAEGVYTIHLGYCEGTTEADKAKDFNCRRNTKYTYNVTVNNVNDIYVEATSDNSIENAPGAEGIISDITGEYLELDAHYEQYNITLTDNELSQFDYRIICYDGNEHPIVIESFNDNEVPTQGNDNYKYLSWIEIIKASENANATAFPLYKPHGATNGAMTLDEFRQKARNNEISAGTYTVFFNEYVYETATDGNESNSTAWRTYVNKPNRQVWFCVKLDESNDKESAYYTSKYGFSQKSIQTYYNASATGPSVALGMEHLNESYGLNLRNSFNNGNHTNSATRTKGTNESNGRFNTAVFLTGSSSDGNYRWNNNLSWETFVDFTKQQTINEINNTIIGITQPETSYPLPSIQTITGTSSNYDPDRTTNPKYIEAITACLNRNRDLNGNEIIEANEIRWYVPGINQYIRMILGRQSLTTPIMDYAANTDLNNKGQNGQRPNLLLYSSSGKVLWAMEGISTSYWNTGGGPQYFEQPTWHVRCVRNLGTDLTAISNTNKVEAAYGFRTGSTDIIEMKYYDSKSIRQEKITQMPPHDIANQDYNRCYKAFQFSNLISIGDLNGFKDYGQDWAEWLRETNPCDLTSLTETGWRVPNQKEIAIMNSLGVTKPTTSYLFSATFSHYDNNGKALTSQNALNITDFKVMAISDSGNGTQDKYSTGNQIRCVRDVD